MVCILRLVTPHPKIIIDFIALSSFTFPMKRKNSLIKVIIPIGPLAIGDDWG
jgi:hypothetical protein